MVDSTIDLLLSEIQGDDKRMTLMNRAIQILAEKLAPSDTHAVIANAINQAEEELEERDCLSGQVAEPQEKA